jgi:hypothetical protein
VSQQTAAVEHRVGTALAERTAGGCMSGTSMTDSDYSGPAHVCASRYPGGAEPVSELGRGDTRRAVLLMRATRLGSTPTYAIPPHPPAHAPSKHLPAPSLASEAGVLTVLCAHRRSGMTPRRRCCRRRCVIHVRIAHLGVEIGEDRWPVRCLSC